MSCFICLAGITPSKTTAPRSTACLLRTSAIFLPSWVLSCHVFVPPGLQRCHCLFQQGQTNFHREWVKFPCPGKVGGGLWSYRGSDIIQPIECRHAMMECTQSLKADFAMGLFYGLGKDGSASVWFFHICKGDQNMFGAVLDKCCED